MRIEIAGRSVEWDDDKAASNARKHGVYFEDAAHIFSDDNRIERFDERHSDDEERWLTIGKVKNILCVIHTERGETTRLISARRATKKEEEMYYGQYTDI